MSSSPSHLQGIRFALHGKLTKIQKRKREPSEGSQAADSRVQKLLKSGNGVQTLDEAYEADHLGCEADIPAPEGESRRTWLSGASSEVDDSVGL